MRFPLLCIVASICALAAAALLAGEAAKPSPIQQDILHYLDNMRPELVAINQDIWTFAELGLQEHRSAARLAGVLKKAGFCVKEGVSDKVESCRARSVKGTNRLLGGDGVVEAYYDHLKPPLSPRLRSVGRPQAAAVQNSCAHLTARLRRQLEET